MAMALSNMAIVYKFKGELDKSIESNLQSLALSRETGDKWSEGATLNNLASALIRKKEYSKANTYALQAEQVARSLGAKEILVATYETLAEIAHESGRAEESFKYLKTMMAVKDSFINLESTRQMAELQTRYETAKTERALLEERFEVSRKNYQLMAAMGLLVLGSLMGFNGYRRYKLRKEKELAEAIMRQQDLATRAVMEAEENERRRIATELHDGVGQMMSAARMNLSAFESEIEQLDPGYRQKLERIVSLVDESCREVRSVSHSMMPNALLKKGLAAAVHDFIDKIDNKVLQVNLYTEGLDERLDPGVESMLYRIIQECVNNVIKHSGASQLDISLVSEEDGISLTVEDNGKGFDTSQKDVFDGIGLRNITSRVQFLKGTVEFDSQPGRGTLVAAHIPKAVI
jgi:signal transduction histidine kinase